MDAVKRFYRISRYKGRRRHGCRRRGLRTADGTGRGGKDGVQGAKTSSPSEGKRFLGGGGFDILKERKRVLL